MRCSSCEPLLDRYVECTLNARQMRQIAAHLQSCESCRTLLAELRVVDGLLFTTAVPDLPENFTFAVMAEVNSMPVPRARQHPVWSFLALYCSAAWVAAVLGMAYTRTSPGVAASAIWNALQNAGRAAGSVGVSTSQSLTHTMPGLAAFGFGVLLLDAVVAAAIAVVYVVVRPRLAARLASAPEVRS